MSINNISLSNGFMCLCGGADYEQIQIERRLKAYGVEPTGNKAADKAKLHEIEVQKVKSQNTPQGTFLTVSYAKEQEIIENKKINRDGNKKSKELKPEKLSSSKKIKNKYSYSEIYQKQNIFTSNSSDKEIQTKQVNEN